MVCLDGRMLYKYLSRSITLTLVSIVHQRYTKVRSSPHHLLIEFFRHNLSICLPESLLLSSSPVPIEVSTRIPFRILLLISCVYQNPGIGLGLVETYLSRPSTTVIAAVRDPNHPTSQKLSSVPKDSSSRLIIAKIDNKCENDPANAVASIKDQGVTTLDLVIANAGIGNEYAPVATCDPAAVKEHIVVNGLGPLFLFQATLPLLRRSERAKFVGIGSPVGSTGGMEMRPFPATAYGSSKAVLHWIVRKIHFEHPELVSLIVDPG